MYLIHRYTGMLHIRTCYICLKLIYIYPEPVTGYMDVTSLPGMRIFDKNLVSSALAIRVLKQWTQDIGIRSATLSCEKRSHLISLSLSSRWPHWVNLLQFLTMSLALWTGLLRMCHRAWLARAQTWILTPVAWLGQTTVVAMSQDLLAYTNSASEANAGSPASHTSPTPYLNRKGLRLPSPSGDLEQGRGSLRYVSCGTAVLWFVVGPRGA